MKNSLILAMILFHSLAWAELDLTGLKCRYAGAKSNIEAQAAYDYTNGLPHLRIKAQQAGDLDALTAILAEIKKTSEGADRSGPPRDAAPELAGLAGRVDQARRRHLLELAGRYQENLRALVVQLTQQGRIDDATAVQRERDDVKFFQAELTSQISPESATAVPSTPVARPETPVPAAKPTLISVSAVSDKGTPLPKLAAGDRLVLQYKSGIWADGPNAPKESPDAISARRGSRLGIYAYDAGTKKIVLLAQVPGNTAETPFEYAFTEACSRGCLMIAHEGSHAENTGTVQYLYTVKPCAGE